VSTLIFILLVDGLRFGGGGLGIPVLRDILNEIV